MSPSRHARQLIAVLVASASAVAGCSASATEKENAVVFATDVQPDCLDPQVSAGDITALVDRNIFDSLVSMTPDGVFHPWLASRWTISPDELTYTFVLRRDVRFHDGTPLDADAVRATLEHAVDKKTKSQYAAGLLTDYAESTVKDPYTVEIRLARPSAPLLQALSTAYLGIQSPKSLRDNEGTLCQHPVGSGPFRFERWTRNDRILLQRNEDYRWNAVVPGDGGPAKIERLDIRYVPEAGVRFGMLTSGQVDIAGAVPPAKVSTLLHSGDFRFLRSDYSGVVYTLLLNWSQGPLADERVRIALARSVRMDELIKSIYFGQYERAWSPLSPATPGYDRENADQPRYDPALAARLLDEAGWTGRDAEGFRTKGGERLSIRWPYTAQLVRDQRDILAQGVQAEAERAGIELRLDGEDSALYVKDFREGKADLLSFSFVRGDADILRYLFGSEQKSEKGGGNIFRLADPELDGWLNAAARTRDPLVRAENYRKVQRYVVDHALVLPTYVPGHLLGTSASISGLRFDAQGYPLFNEVSRTGGAS